MKQYHYEGFTAEVEYSPEDGLFYGKLVSETDCFGEVHKVEDLVDFMAEHADNIEYEMKLAVHDYCYFKNTEAGLLRYPAVVSEGKLCTVKFPDLDVCVQADTKEEADKLATEQAIEKLARLKNKGLPFPEPTDRWCTERDPGEYEEMHMLFIAN